MIQPDPWWDTIYSALSLGIAAFAVIAVLVKRLEHRGQPVLHLDAMAVFLSLQALDMIDSLAWDAPTPYPPALVGGIDLLYPLFMVSLWMFVRAVTTPAARLHRRDLWHLLPLLVGVILYLPFLTLPVAVRFDLATGATAPAETVHIVLAGLGEVLFWLMWIGVLGTYSVLCARRLWTHQRNIRTLYADLDGRRLWWLTGLVIGILGLAWSVVVEELVALIFDYDVIDGWVQGLQEILISAVIGIFALRAEPALKPWTADVLASDAETGPLTVVAPAQPETPETRYARSGLDTDRLGRLRRKIDAAMDRDQIWRQHGLRLMDLSERTGITPIHLSEVLNTEIGQSFYDYVNGYRVRDACALLRETDETVLTISETVGFTSKSTFNTHFKRVTGQTPTGYRDTARRANVA